MPRKSKAKRKQARRKPNPRSTFGRKGQFLEPSDIYLSNTGGLEAPLAMDISRPRVYVESIPPSCEGAEAAVTGVDFIGTYNSSSSTDQIISLILNPLNSVTFPRASAGAAMWRRYNLMECQFLLFGINAATQGGFLAMASVVTDDLASKVTPDSEAEILNMEGCAVIRPWSGGVHNVHLASKGLKWYTLDNSTVDNATFFGENVGRAFLFIPETEADDDISVQVYVKYTIDYSIRVPVTLTGAESFMTTAGTFAEITDEGVPSDSTDSTAYSAIARAILPVAWSNVTNYASRNPSDIIKWLYSSFSTGQLASIASTYPSLATVSAALGAANTVSNWGSWFGNAWGDNDATTVVSDTFRANFVADAYAAGGGSGSSLIDGLLAGLSASEVDTIITGLGGTPGPLTRIEAYKRSRQLQGKPVFDISTPGVIQGEEIRTGNFDFGPRDLHGLKHVSPEGIIRAKGQASRLFETEESKRKGHIRHVSSKTRSRCLDVSSSPPPALQEVAQLEETEVLKEELRCLRDQIQIYLKSLVTGFDASV
jgi:hypothetical protein